MTVAELITVLQKQNQDDIVIYNTAPILDALRNHPERRMSCAVEVVTSGSGFVVLEERMMDYSDRRVTT